MTTSGIVDTCVHQWTVDYSEMKDLVPDKWGRRLGLKSKIQDPTVGTLMPTIPYYHDYWNSDTPDYERPESGAYTDSEAYRSPQAIERHLSDAGVDSAILAGHETMFLPSLPHPGYKAAIASAYNELLMERWVTESARLQGAVLVSLADPEAAVAEIERYADNPDMVAVLVYGGGTLPMGHEFHHPIYAAAERAGMPVIVHTSGNPTNRQTASGMPEHFVSYDTMLVQNHMYNLISLVFQGVLEEFSDLDWIWAGQGVSWIHQTMWRCTRYWRNASTLPPDMEMEPHEYITDRCYVTTYPIGDLPSADLERLYEMFGVENILYASGYPHWNADTTEALPDLDDDARNRILSGNAGRVFGL